MAGSNNNEIDCRKRKRKKKIGIDFIGPAGEITVKVKQFRSGKDFSASILKGSFITVEFFFVFLLPPPPPLFLISFLFFFILF